MKPRIFVSSTFYDLKYIREDLSNFIKAHDFEPIMFEDGDIGYTPGQPMDRSCYETMRSADMVLLIIGGNYGSAAEGEEVDEFREYISVTRNEFKSATSAGVPIFVFVDSKVQVEYEIYEANCEKIEKRELEINFINVKNINVFRFIKEIKGIGKLPIIEFDKVIQIKDFLSKQWADMFKKYLGILKENEKDENVRNTVEDMNILVRKMNLMLDSMGKKILADGNTEDYDKVVVSQQIMGMCDKISTGFRLGYDEKTNGKRKAYIEKFLDVLKYAIDNHIFEKNRNEEEMINIAIFFERNGINIGMIRYGFEEYADEFIKMYNTEKELMIQELNKDNYAKQLFR